VCTFEQFSNLTQLSLPVTNCTNRASMITAQAESRQVPFKQRVLTFDMTMDYGNHTTSKP